MGCIIVLYDKTNRKLKVDEARQHQFLKRGRGMEIIPPTQTALGSTLCVQGTNVSELRIWEKRIEKEQRLPDSTAWGWQGNIYTG